MRINVLAVSQKSAFALMCFGDLPPNPVGESVRF